MTPDEQIVTELLYMVKREAARRRKAAMMHGGEAGDRLEEVLFLFCVSYLELERVIFCAFQVTSSMLESIPYVNVWVKQQAGMVQIKVMLYTVRSLFELALIEH